MSNYKTVHIGGTGEIIEKKSRFIATVIPIDNEDAAINFIGQTKKKYWDASHNCSAYILGNKNETTRCSDDGEPSNTAGKPMLDVLLMEGIHNTAVVVTRYFGGTLLGTGGLVRAYQAAVKEGLKNSVIIEKKYAGIYNIITDYNGIGKIQYIAGIMKINILNTEYTDSVKSTILLTPEKENEFIKCIQEATNGKTEIIKSKEVYFAEYNKEILLYKF